MANPFASNEKQKHTNSFVFNPKFNKDNTIQEIEAISDSNYRNDYITFTNLKDERDWSNSLITKFLKEPDLLTKNSNNKKLNCKLYLLEKVINIENTEEFKEAFNKIQKRRNSSLKVADKKRQDLLDYINNLNITIREFENKEKLYTAARKHYNRLQDERGEHFNYVRKDADEIFMKRITTNFLRHTSDEYEIELDKLIKKIGRQQAYSLLKNRVNEIIYEKYPFLKYTIDEIYSYF